MTAPTSPLLTVEDVAQHLHLSPAKVRGLAREGRVVASRIGSRWLFTEQAIADYLDEQSNRPSLPHRRRRRRLSVPA